MEIYIFMKILFLLLQRHNAKYINNNLLLKAMQFSTFKWLTITIICK